MEIKTSTTAAPELLHPEDAEYIWLPFVVLVGVGILAGLVYAMSRIRCAYNCFRFKRRSATRNGYVNVDEEEDSDVSMVGADDLGERNPITYLLDARLHISPPRQESRQSSHKQADANDVAVLA